jgi:hypothetical protein
MIEQNREANLQERVNLLKNIGYCGFKIKGSQSKFDGVEVSVENSKGKTLTAEGETIDEAYENAVEAIDYYVDNIE